MLFHSEVVPLTLGKEKAVIGKRAKHLHAICRAWQVRVVPTTITDSPEALDKGCFILAGINEHDLIQAVETAVEMNNNGDNGLPVPNYTDENVSTKIVKLIQSYTGIVNKMVWRK